MHIGQKIKLIRKLQGLTQDELADKINKTRPLISTIERTGQGHPYTINAICSALKIKPAQLEAFAEKDIRDYILGKTEPNKKEVEALNREVELLRELLEAKQEQIKMLQEELAIYKKKKK
jgi:transcriptional regulator with XRE-family HTH domain